MSKTEEITKIYVGVDLHKTQFTVNAIDGETGEVVLIGMFRTDCEGYNAYIEKMHCIEEKSGNSIEMAVEATGNARYFKNRMEKEKLFKAKRSSLPDIQMARTPTWHQSADIR